MANKSKHTGLGVALGAALGAVAGVLAGHIAVWLGIGVAIGMVLGTSFRRAEKECPQCAALHVSHEDRSCEDRTHETNQKQLQS
jgi:ribosomal protein S27AE